MVVFPLPLRVWPWLLHNHCVGFYSVRFPCGKKPRACSGVSGRCPVRSAVIGVRWQSIEKGSLRFCNRLWELWGYEILSA